MMVAFLRRLFVRSSSTLSHTAPRCRRCGQALAWRKAHLFEERETADAVTRARFAAIRGEWYCPTCTGSHR
jgi:hypothetical protein